MSNTEQYILIEKICKMKIDPIYYTGTWNKHYTIKCECGFTGEGITRRCDAERIYKEHKERNCNVN